ncbi:MAG: hydrogenase maturation protease [Chromatiales bacterium]|nr:hydrogenase maturation protease [Chromatiales bacterium]
MINSFTPPVLIFGYGNPSRGDDALGPLMLEQIDSQPEIELLTDFQLQVEHSLDMVGRELILFIDASESCPEPFQFRQLDCENHQSVSPGYTTHTLTPTELIAAYRSVHHHAPPPSFLLTIRGEQYELGTPLSALAHSNLKQAQQWISSLLGNPSLQHWQQALKEVSQLVA